MTTYAPTVNPGDVRTRTRYIGIRSDPGAVPQIDVLEQEVIRTATGERVLADLGSLPVGAFDPAFTFPLRDPETDAEIGQDGTAGQAMAYVYGWIRAKQLARDAALLAAEITRTAQLALADADNGAAAEPVPDPETP